VVSCDVEVGGRRAFDAAARLSVNEGRGAALVQR
jgi:hypothetical protein